MNSNYKSYIRLIAILGCLAVILGAFGAHFLKEKLSATSLNAYKTGVQYHFCHTLAALLGALLMRMSKDTNKQLLWSVRCFILGVFLFSGSLYLLAIKDWLALPFLGIMGPITPLGGLVFMLGWIFLFLSMLPKRTD